VDAERGDLLSRVLGQPPRLNEVPVPLADGCGAPGPGARRKAGRRHRVGEPPHLFHGRRALGDRAVLLVKSERVGEPNFVAVRLRLDNLFSAILIFQSQ